jgi:hypothetical protein
MSRRAVQLDPRRSSNRADLGHLLWEAAKPLALSNQPGKAEQLLREALQVFEQAAHDFPDEPYLHQEEAYGSSLLAGMLERTGQHQAAVA